MSAADDATLAGSALVTAATGPAGVTVDGMTTTNYPLADLIAAHKYLAGLAAAGNRNRGLRFNTLVPDGTANGRRYQFDPDNTFYRYG